MNSREQFFYDAVGWKVKKLRKAQGITLQAMSEGIHITAPFLCDVENGRRRASLRTLLKIADFLRVKVADLVLENKTLFDGERI